MSDEKLRAALIKVLLDWRWRVNLPANQGYEPILEIAMTDASCENFADHVITAINNAD